MAEGGEQVSRALALMDQFYVSMMESGVLKILSFQYECFAEISEDTYLKFLANFSTLATSVKTLHEEIFTADRVDAECQTPSVSLPGNTLINPVKLEDKPLMKLEPIRVQKVKLVPSQEPPSPKPKVKTVIKRDPMVCDYCEQKFTTLENFELHIRQVHGDQFSRSVFTCDHCEQHFLSSETLYEHISCAHVKDTDEDEVGDQLCAYCAELFSSWQTLADHMANSHSLHMCKTCHIMCETTDKLDKHIQDVHLTGVKPELIETIPLPPRPVGRPPKQILKPEEQVQPVTPRKRGRPRKVLTDITHKKEFTCTICNLVFIAEESLKKHVIQRHEPMSHELICKKCGLKFRRRPALDNHMRIVHRKGDYYSDTEDDYILPDAKPPRSPLVEKSVPVVLTVPSDTTKKPLAVRQPNLVRAGRLSCEICGEMCPKAEDQEIHRDHHVTRTKDLYLCLYCKAPAMKQPELRTHIVSEHRFRCPFCSLTFWWKANLESHMTQLHNSKSDCPLCGHKSSSVALREHIVLEHTPKKMYICKLCNAEYNTVRALHDHEFTHANEKQGILKCDYCQRCFWIRCRLRNHISRHLHGSFCCYLCGQQCQTKGQLQEHLTRHRKSQFACFCGQRFASKIELRNHHRSNVCKQGITTNPKADIFVEVCVPGDEEEELMDVGSTIVSSTAKLQRISDNEESQPNVWQINIALPAESPAHLSRDFLSALANTVNSNSVQEPETLSVGNQPILILDTTNDNSETTIIGEQPAEIIQWMQDQGFSVATVDESSMEIKEEKAGEELSNN